MQYNIFYRKNCYFCKNLIYSFSFIANLKIMNTIKKSIIEKGNSLGFPVIKFAKEELLTKEIEHLNTWLSLEYNAGMDYLQRNIDKRESIKLLFDNIKTIIVFAYPYPANVGFKGKLKISKDSVVPDYHKTIKEKLYTISEFLFNEFKINSKCFVDTAPILEKQWAVRSGLGWQGKNSIIINPILGSYFNIGVMLIDVELEPDTQLENRCGTCQQCIDACPTSAIVSDKVIDCRQCIVKYTVSRSEEFPCFIKDAIKKAGYIYGCDICQDVCPHNKKRQTEEKIIYDIINKIEYMDENEFNNIFQHYKFIGKGYQRILEHIKIANA